MSSSFNSAVGTTCTVKRSGCPTWGEQYVDRFASTFCCDTVLSFDAAAAQAYGQIIARGWVKGRDYERMPAAHAIATASVLVTNNDAVFKDIPNLTLENWAIGG